MAKDEKSGQGHAVGLQKTYHDDSPDKHDVHEKGPRIREPCRASLKLRAVLVQKVRIHEYAELWACYEERSDDTPYLWWELEDPVWEKDERRKRHEATVDAN